MPRNYDFWTNEDVQRLKDMVASNISRKEIYKAFPNRSASGVKFKLNKLGLTGHFKHGMNPYRTVGDATYVTVYKVNGESREFIIDTEDRDFVLMYGRWHLAERENGLYVTARTPYLKRRDIYLHRFITECPKGYVVDHIDGNTLDFRKSNLRVVDYSANSQNLHNMPRHNTSGYRGVSWCKHNKKWRAVIKIKGKQFGGKYFDDKEEAHKYVVALRAKYMPYSEDARGVVNL